MNHGCHNEVQLIQAFKDQENGQIRLNAGNYPIYSEWVFWDLHSPPTQSEVDRCPDGMVTLPNDYGYLCFVQDKAPGPFQGVVTYAISGQEFEMKAPYNGLLLDGSSPFVQEGMTINVSFSIETSGEYGTPHRWCSDTGLLLLLFCLINRVSSGLPIQGYYMEGNSTNSPVASAAGSSNGYDTETETETSNTKLKWGSLAIIVLETGVILILVVVVIGLLYSRRKSAETMPITSSWD